MAISIALELKMYESLRQGLAGDAWNMLVDSQNFALASRRTNELFMTWFEARHVRLFNIECVSFPKQTFVSMGGTIDTTECSICNDDLMKCDHNPGEPYMGQFCQMVVKGMAMDHLAIVDNPASKHHRLFEISGRDTLTRGVVRPKEG